MGRGGVYGYAALHLTCKDTRCFSDEVEQLRQKNTTHTSNRYEAKIYGEKRLETKEHLWGK